MRRSRFEAALLALALTRCVSANAPAGQLGDEGDVVVVERSKAQPPAWAAEAPGKLIETPQDRRVVTVRSKLLNLPLGLKQTQLAGVDALRGEVGKWVKESLLAEAQVRKVPVPSRPEPLDRAVRAAVDEIVGPQGKVTDIYFESIENHALPAGDPMATYHAAYVLAVFPKDQAPVLFKALSRRLAAGDQALRALAPVCQALAARP